MLCATVQYLCLGRGKPGVDMGQRLLKAAGGIEDLWIGHDGQEFVQAVHRDPPRLATFCQRFDAGKGLLVKIALGAVRIHQDVGIDCNH